MTGRGCCPQRPVGFAWSRLAGVAFGLGVQALFVVTVVYLYAFLRWGALAGAANWFWTDLLLTLQFAVPHSILLHPRFRDVFRRRFPGELHGAFFCLATCISLLLLFGFWRTAPEVIWELDGAAESVIVGCFHLSWASLLYSISLTGLGYQTGLTQWFWWYRGVKQGRREFRAQSLYRVLRHPVYLSFLGLIWFTPVMTADHAVLTGVWTVYIFAGSILKDQRLLYYLGQSYAEYMSRVAGYPGISAGPLGRRPLTETAPATSEASAGSVASGVRAA
jgi:protein-S-isoprenylcysteine O-methyltransferase Ste14